MAVTGTQLARCMYKHRWCLALFSWTNQVLELISRGQVTLEHDTQSLTGHGALSQDRFLLVLGVHVIQFACMYWVLCRGRLRYPVVVDSAHPWTLNHVIGWRRLSKGQRIHPRCTLISSLLIGARQRTLVYLGPSGDLFYTVFRRLHNIVLWQ